MSLRRAAVLLMCAAVPWGAAACTSGEVVVPTPQPGEAAVLDSAQAAELIRRKEVLIVDARPHADFLKRRLVGVQSWDFSDPEMWATRVSTADPERSVAVYCDTSECSAAATQALIDEGFTEVYDLGGVEEWDPDHLSIHHTPS